jgi:dTDP-4-amino-4,6-dideoxygalactose transaminase
VLHQGFRYHLGAIPASIGLSQLALLDEFVCNRQDYCRGYNQRLDGIPEVITPTPTRVVGLAQRAEHPVGHRLEVAALGLESLRQPVVIVHWYLPPSPSFIAVTDQPQPM